MTDWFYQRWHNLMVWGRTVSKKANSRINSWCLFCSLVKWRYSATQLGKTTEPPSFLKIPEMGLCIKCNPSYQFLASWLYSKLYSSKKISKYAYNITATFIVVGHFHNARLWVTGKAEGRAQCSYNTVKQTIIMEEVFRMLQECYFFWKMDLPFFRPVEYLMTVLIAFSDCAYTVFWIRIDI